ncbi:MAG: TIGR04255 family protein [Caldiserica bacterium]|jgi:uncharacterized protein (TIGR04255 family)|nr:TIGR04255 family protein [Caldisericota bacterium]
MSRKYKKPPVVEALCEFQFIPNQQWDLTVPGLIYRKVKDEFPNKQQQIGVSVQFKPTEKGLEHTVESAPPRIQFFRKDKTALIQVAQDLLVVNQLKPYPTWNAFKPVILKCFNIYKEIANPKAFKRIGLRYINIIEFDNKRIKLEDYFRYYPYVPNDLPPVQDSFIVRTEFPYEEGKERVILSLATVIPSKPNVLSILLDIDYVMATPELVPLDKVSEWLEKAHERVENVFEACITDKAREIFGEEKS